MPCLPTVSNIREQKQQLILTGELNIGEPCAPFHFTKSIDGNVEFKDGQICGRKLPLKELRVELLNKQENYMRLFTDDQIKGMSREDNSFMVKIHCRLTSDASLAHLQDALSKLQRNRTLAMWHVHSTILQTGYILFAVWIIYDPAVFYTSGWKEKRDRVEQTFNH